MPPSSLQPSRLVVRPLNHLCQRGNATLSTPLGPNPAESSTAPRLRFAPSPTGPLHIGGLRTALVNHVLAKKWKGTWLLRLEDTDRERFIPGSMEEFRKELDWAGLDYDEGVGVGGKFGPYIQSERLDLYRYWVDHLIEHNKAYECFCRPVELMSIRQNLEKEFLKAAYDGRCRHLSQEERARRKKAGRPYVVRFKGNRDRLKMEPDLVFGDIPTKLDDINDFIILKTDGYPTYHLASVVDDHCMQISHVIRGAEWIPSTPKHQALYNAFKWTAPRFGHLPLLVDQEGKKLAKRKAHAQVKHYRETGYEPDALVNLLALLGWDYHSAMEEVMSRPGAAMPASLTSHLRNDSNSLHEVMSLDQVIEAFDLKHLTHRNAGVDEEKLKFLNKMALRRKAGRLGLDGDMLGVSKDGTGEIVESQEREKLLDRFQNGLREHQDIQNNPLIEDRKYITEILDAELPRAICMKDLPEEAIRYFLEPDYKDAESVEYMESIVKENYDRNVGAMTEELGRRIQSSRLQNPKLMESFDEDLVWNAANHLTRTLGLRARSEILIPMRHALTGQRKGPQVPTIMRLLGLERSMARLRSGREVNAQRTR